MWIAILLFIAILFLLAYLDTRKPKNYPPGPRWLPIIGSAWSVHKLRKQTGFLYEATGILAKKYGNGKLVGLKVGQDKQVIVYGGKEILEFLTNDDLAGRPQGVFYRTRTWGIRRGILLTDEEFWQEQRRFILRQLREFGFGRRNMSTLIEDEVHQMINDIKTSIDANGGESVLMPVNDAFSVYVLNTLWMMMAGIRYNQQDKDLKNIQSILTDLFANVDMVGTLFSQFPILRFIAPEFSGYKTFVQTHHRVWEFLRKELDHHMATYKENEHPRDFMDVYIKALKSEERKPSFSEDQLLAVCMDLFMAGSETTTKSLMFSVLYLLLFPEVQTKVQEEVDRVVGRDRQPTLNDRPEMPYTEALVYESIRMFMGRGFGVPHRALRDTKLAGYDIPKDTMVIANCNGILFSEITGSDYAEFKPDRYMKDGKLSLPEDYYPFGFGKHRCMGETLAKANIFLFLGTLLQNFTFSIPPGHKRPSTVAVDGVTPSPQPFFAKVTPRPR